jgi:hypothetical protein
MQVYKAAAVSEGQALLYLPPCMPELAEVAFYTTRWAAGVGQEVRRVHTGSKARPFRQTAAGAFRALVGTTYGGARTHGKNMLFEFAPQLWLTGHLGMTGELLAAPPEHVPTVHDHLVLYTREEALIFRDFRMFGALRLEEWAGGPPASGEVLAEAREKRYSEWAGACRRLGVNVLLTGHHAGNICPCKVCVFFLLYATG